MTKAIKEIYTSEVSIVLLGNFNPIVFQPTWFSSQELLRSGEAEKAEVSIIHPDVTSFTTEWLSLQVTRDRFIALTRSEPHAPHLRDLVLGTFMKLSHTPVKQMGINVHKNITFNTEQDWHNWGHFVAPKSPWKGFDRPGLMSLTMRSERSDYPGYFTTTIAHQESCRVVVTFNDHYEQSEAPGAGNIAVPASKFVDLIENEFEKSLRTANDMLATLVKKFESQGEYDDGR